MTPTIEPVPDALLFDTDQVCSLTQLQALYAVGFRGGIRTVTFNQAPDPSDVTAEEVQNFMTAGLGLMLYQRVRNPGWLPSATMGQADAKIFLAKAAAAGYLAGGSAWDDLEGIGGNFMSTIAYEQAKSATLLTVYPPGDYIGYDVPLNSDELFHDLLAKCFWKSISNVPDVATRGYALSQVAENVTIAGVEVDISVSRADRLGGRAFWMRNV
jgi:hypothetical protein